MVLSFITLNRVVQGAVAKIKLLTEQFPLKAGTVSRSYLKHGNVACLRQRQIWLKTLELSAPLIHCLIRGLLFVRLWHILVSHLFKRSFRIIHLVHLLTLLRWRRKVWLLYMYINKLLIHAIEYCWCLSCIGNIELCWKRIYYIFDFGNGIIVVQIWGCVVYVVFGSIMVCGFFIRSIRWM